MKYLAFFLLLAFSFSAEGQNEEATDTVRMDFELYDPPSTLVVPEHPVYQAKYPFIDVHSHQWRMNEMDLGPLVQAMDSINMGVMVNLSGRGGKELAAIMDNLKSQPQHAGRFLVFTNINLRSIDDPDWTVETVKQIEYDVSIGAAGLKIYKSQGMSNVDSSGNRIRINDPRIDPVWAKCGELGIPVLIHSADPAPFWQPHDENNERWLELKTHPRRKQGPEDDSWETIIGEQHDIFKKHPNTTFIAAHMGWYANDLAHLGELLDDMPNVYVEIGAVIAELGRQPRMANRFFEKYQDRVLFGKDAWNKEEYFTYFRVLESDDEYFPYYKRYHAFWKMYGLDLPDGILQKLYFRNALKLFPQVERGLFPE